MLIGRPSQEEEDDRLYSDHLSNVWYLATFFIAQIPPPASHIKGLEDKHFITLWMKTIVQGNIMKVV
jgi:hypothetical protein